MFDYYDLILAIIPITVFASVGIAFTLGVVPVAIVGGALAALLTGHAMFVRGPTPDAPRDANPPVTP